MTCFCADDACVAAQRSGDTIPPDGSGSFRDHFVEMGDQMKTWNDRKTIVFQGFRDAGGGTRTPDTRIMIPLL